MKIKLPLAALFTSISMSHGALVIFYDDFEAGTNDFSSDLTTGGYTNTNDVNDLQSDGFTSGAINADLYVGTTQGFGAGRKGLVDESHGDFTDPGGEQAYATRYTNSGITTQDGLIGTINSLGSGGAGYIGLIVTLDVIIDGHNNTTPWNIGLVTFAPGADRDDIRGGGIGEDTASVLISDTGNAPVDGSYQQISITYMFADAPQSGTLNPLHDIAFRVDGATSSAIIDNVTIEAIPEPSSTALLGLAGMSLLLRRRR